MCDQLRKQPVELQESEMEQVIRNHWSHNFSKRDHGSITHCLKSICP